ncbi:hydroxymethylbilane synthase [Flindersiella endophytica]
MTGRTLRVGTRRSKLALVQTGLMVDALRAAGQSVEVVEVTTEGDRNRAPLSRIGGTGVFVSAIREALLAGEIDVAVHSLKDLPTDPAEGITLAAVPPRENPFDVLIARDGLTLEKLPAGSTVGTGSMRRMAQLRMLRPDLTYVEIRGNVDTRIGKMRDGQYDAVVLAMAGLSRLGRADEVTEEFTPDQILPSPGQGALAVECQTADEKVVRVLAGLDDPRTRAAVTAERAVLNALAAGCSAPVGAFATVTEPDTLRVSAAVVAVEGSPSFRLSTSGPLDRAEELGRELASALLAEGAIRLIEEHVK